MRRPILQVALDFMNLHRALKVAEEAVAGGADWLEAGTPLIKAEGLDAVRALKRQFPKYTIVADMKTVDVGRLEVEMAAKAGADVVVVLAISDEATIREAVEAAHNYGCRVMADLLFVNDPVKRACWLREMGVDYVCVHVSIDQQMRGMKPLDVLEQVVAAIGSGVAVAGGINSETAAEAVRRGAEIVIVGGAIIKAPDAREATRKIRRAMDSAKPVPTELYKKYRSEEELRQVFAKVSTPNISDAMHRRGVIQGLIPVAPGVKMVGRAITVRTYPGDWAKPVEAVDTAKPGSVIVIDAGGVGPAVWGELASWSCLQKGVAGVVVYGAVRDVDEIRKMKFPVFAKLIVPHAGEPRGFGEINVPIRIGDILVRPGDWVIGDDNGVVVVPKERAVEVANRALDVMEKENRIRKEIQEGGTLSAVLRLREWERVT